MNQKIKEWKNERMKAKLVVWVGRHEEQTIDENQQSFLSCEGTIDTES
jgi:hypothetical protein